jgi:hypothetical protein
MFFIHLNVGFTVNVVAARIPLNSFVAPEERAARPQREHLRDWDVGAEKRSVWRSGGKKLMVCSMSSQNPPWKSRSTLSRTRKCMWRSEKRVADCSRRRGWADSPRLRSLASQTVRRRGCARISFTRISEDAIGCHESSSIDRRFSSIGFAEVSRCKKTINKTIGRNDTDDRLQMEECKSRICRDNETISISTGCTNFRWNLRIAIIFFVSLSSLRARLKSDPSFDGWSLFSCDVTLGCLFLDSSKAKLNLFSNFSFSPFMLSICPISDSTVSTFWFITVHLSPKFSE